MEVKVGDVVGYRGYRGWYLRDKIEEFGYGIVIDFCTSKKSKTYVAKVWWPHIQMIRESSPKMLNVFISRSKK